MKKMIKIFIVWLYIKIRDTRIKSSVKYPFIWKLEKIYYYLNDNRL
jgi:hypothetical protein